MLVFKKADILFRFSFQLLKPKLSRKIVPSARINLNNFWDAFEDVSKQKSAVVTFESPNLAEVLRSTAFSTFHDNAINENLVNELLELGKL